MKKIAAKLFCLAAVGALCPALAYSAQVNVTTPHVTVPHVNTHINAVQSNVGGKTTGSNSTKNTGSNTTKNKGNAADTETLGFSHGVQQPVSEGGQGGAAGAGAGKSKSSSFSIDNKGTEVGNSKLELPQGSDSQVTNSGSGNVNQGSNSPATYNGNQQQGNNQQQGSTEQGLATSTYNQIEQMMSNTQKSESDTSSAIIGNLKQ